MSQILLDLSVVPHFIYPILFESLFSSSSFDLASLSKEFSGKALSKVRTKSAAPLSCNVSDLDLYGLLSLASKRHLTMENMSQRQKMLSCLLVRDFL